MRLNFGKRLVLILHGVMSLIAAAMAVMFCAWPNTINGLLDQLKGLIGVQKTEIIGIAALSVYVVLTALAAWVLFAGRGQKGQRGMITVDSSEAGKTRIAVSAVEQMIRQAVRGVDGIREMKSRIINHEDSISINTHVAVANGAHVPTVTMNIQRAIRSYIELNCGVAVREVSVNVHAVDNSENGRHIGKKSAEPVFAPKQEPEVRPEPVFAPKQEPEVRPEPVFAPKQEPEARPEPVFAPEPQPAAENFSAEEPNFTDESDFADEPIRLTFDPPQEMVNENHPIDEE